MTFLLLKNYDYYAIVNDDADFIAGRVYPLNGRQGPYRVTASVGPLDRETREAGIVKSLDDAITVFLAYYKRGSSAESVGGFWLRQFAKSVI